MRAHGVPDFPDPSPSGGIQLSFGMNPFSPPFRAAHASCKQKLPGGGPPDHAGPQVKAEMLAMSECMRQHGITGFPDPTSSLPLSPSNYSLVTDRGGVVLAVPKTIDPSSPAFQQAATACKFH